MSERLSLPPPDCLDVTPGSPVAGQPCSECPYPSPCQVLAAGRRIAEQNLGAAGLRGELSQHDQLNALLLERLLNLRSDILVESAFTPEGLRDHLEHDEEIQSEMKTLAWGVVRMDGRFV